MERGYGFARAFKSVGEYRETGPTIMLSVEQSLRTITNLKYLIVTSLRDSLYQVPLAKESVKW